MRILHPVVGLCLLAVVLTGCSQEAGPPAGATLTMPAEPHVAPPDGGTAEDDAPAAPGPDAAVPEGGASGSGGTGPSTEAGPSPHCVIVAGGLTTAVLAPLGLRSSEDHGRMVELEQELLDLRDKLPADLKDDFEVLAHSVEAPPTGSGTFDEAAFRRAMEPVQDWLGQHCEHP